MSKEWFVINTPANGLEVCWRQNDPMTQICVMRWTDGLRADVEAAVAADARLIAAAPELLEACRAVIADGFLDRPSLNKCCTAIAKAEGR